MSEHATTWSAQDFHLGAEVRSSDGRVVGELKRVLVEDQAYALKAIVVKEGGRFSGLLLSPGSLLLADEVIVPIEAVAKVSHDAVELKLSSADLRRLPPYLSFRTEPETPTEEFSEQVAVLGSSPAIPASYHEVANKPPGELEIEGGENVMLGQTGKRLGTVRDVLFDDGELVGVVVRPDGWFKHDVILPRRFLDRSDDAALFAHVGEDEIKRLELFEPDQIQDATDTPS
jgi:sporulation protein YlmC with PRC-barrel domain